MRTTLGCSTPAIERASRRNRARAAPSPARLSVMTLIATRRWSVSSSARNTWPMPPAPSECRMRYPRMAGSVADTRLSPLGGGGEDDAPPARLEGYEVALLVGEEPRGQGRGLRLRQQACGAAGGQQPRLLAHDRARRGV